MPCPASHKLSDDNKMITGDSNNNVSFQPADISQNPFCHLKNEEEDLDCGPQSHQVTAAELGGGKLLQPRGLAIVIKHWYFGGFPIPTSPFLRLNRKACC